MMTDRPARFIHVGTGGWGHRWSDTFLPHLARAGKAIPVAAVARSPEGLREAQVGYGIEPRRCYTDDTHAFAENPPDFAVIVVPPKQHEQMVDATIAHDCHILSDKPIADTMIAASRTMCSLAAPSLARMKGNKSAPVWRARGSVVTAPLPTSAARCGPGSRTAARSWGHGYGVGRSARGRTTEERVLVPCPI